ncbi:MAG: hypothetical protein M3N28_01160 [Actinomycetota bacterium]|nr:hypothetical protein [Actinomycetota bacterium]
MERRSSSQLDHTDRRLGPGTPIGTVDSVRRQALLQAKLGALVAEHRGTHWPGPENDSEAVTGTFPGGATLRAGPVGWVLAEDRPERALGGALVWSRRHEISEVHVMAEEATGLLARRAGAFAQPPQVWRIEGRSLAAAEPEPPVSEPPLPPEAETFVTFLSEAGVEPVIEHGVLSGEVLGLEVARVVVEELGVFLEVGVGKHDRYAQRLLNQDRPPLEALVAAADAVRALRNPEAPAHQVNRLSRERWLRSILVAQPALVGASALAPIPAPTARTDLRHPLPAPAAGLDTEGRPVVVVCSIGIDVDLVPAAADVRLSDGRGARLILAVPAADDHPLIRDLAAALAEPAEIVAIPGDWRRLEK